MGCNQFSDKAREEKPQSKCKRPAERQHTVRFKFAQKGEEKTWKVFVQEL